MDSIEYHDANDTTEETTRKEETSCDALSQRSTIFQGGYGSSSLKECIELLETAKSNTPAPLDSGVGKSAEPPQNAPIWGGQKTTPPQIVTFWVVILKAAAAVELNSIDTGSVLGLRGPRPRVASALERAWWFTSLAQNLASQSLHSSID